MIQVNERLSEPATAAATLTLPYELRQKSRLRACLDDGREVALMLPRGTLLRDGDLLRAADGLVIRVVAAEEAVSELTADDAVQLARACYHLGNRHVPLQIGAGWARYLHDHVLDDMVRGLGLAVAFAQRPFEPESGAYHGHDRHAHGTHDNHDHH